MRIIKVIVGVYLGIILVSAVLGLLGLLIGLTFGIFGALLGLCLKLLFHPIIIVFVALYLLYRYNMRRV